MMPRFPSPGYGTPYGDVPLIDGMTRDELYESFAPRIAAMARRLKARIPADAAVELEDLINSGAVGLLDAMNRYDPKRPVQFGTFADFRIRGAMLDVLRRLDPVSRQVRSTANRLGEAAREVEADLGRPAEAEEIAAHLGVDIHTYWELVDEGRDVMLVSFENARYEDSRPLTELIEDPRSGSVEEQVAMKEALNAMSDAIVNHLTERQRTVLTLYYMKDLTLREIGEVLGITESRVSQIHSEACLRLRPHLRDWYSGSGPPSRGQKRKRR
jgi:RNA polymerase sigma factor FliA